MTNFSQDPKPNFESESTRGENLEPPKINKTEVKSAIKEIIEKNKEIERKLNVNL